MRFNGQDGNPAYRYKDKLVCFALYYYSLSTFIGSPGIFIEDLFVRPELRRKGMGTILLSYLANLAKERGCWGLEWACLDWNEPPVKFYKGLGALLRDGWTMYRLRAIWKSWQKSFNI